jgi:hypothetical protein
MQFENLPLQPGSSHVAARVCMQHDGKIVLFICKVLTEGIVAGRVKAAAQGYRSVIAFQLPRKYIY